MIYLVVLLLLVLLLLSSLYFHSSMTEGVRSDLEAQQIQGDSTLIEDHGVILYLQNNTPRHQNPEN